VFLAAQRRALAALRRRNEENRMTLPHEKTLQSRAKVEAAPAASGCTRC